MDELSLLKKKLEREKKARKEAEELLENKTREVYFLNKGLEKQVETRTEELKLARDEAVRANRAKSQFLANMSHEIRTPLHGILGLLELLSKSKLSPTQHEQVETVTYSGKMLLTIINEILDFSKIEAGKFEFEFRTFNLVHSIENLADVLANEAYKKGLEVSVFIDDSVPEYLDGDDARVRQVLLNLIGNAIKFTPDGEIAIRVSIDHQGCNEHQCHVLFSVKDTGIGIPADKISQILLPFEQVDVSDTRKYGGSGLGLAISNHIIKGLGGKLDVESQEAKGSDFRFTIPFKKGQSESLSKRKANSLTDDEVFIALPVGSIRADTQNLLQLWGCTIHLFSSLEEALLAIENSVSNRKLHLLCDGCGPDSDYIRIRDRVNKLVANKNLNLIVTTKPAQKSIVSEKIGQMNAHILSRPIKGSHLHLAIKNEKKDVAENQIDVRKSKQIAHILLVDDNDINQQVASAMLSALGFTYEIADNGVKAIEMYKAKASYHIILMDCQMPVMDGYEATKAIRDLEKNSGTHTPIIGVTANAFRKTKEKCFESGMDGFLTKPFKQEELEITIQKYLTKLLQAS